MNINRKEPQTNMPQNVGSKKTRSAKIYEVRTHSEFSNADLTTMYSVCTTYYANRSTTVVDRLLSTISIAEFLMCLPFHTLQLTHKIPTRLYMGTLAGRALFGWSLFVSVCVGYYRGYLHWRDK